MKPALLALPMAPAACASGTAERIARLEDRGGLIEGLSSALTEARVAEALLRPLEG